MDSISRAIANALKEGKWLDITYDSSVEERDTSFWCSVKDIDPDRKILICDIFNSNLSLDAKTDVRLSYEKIKTATTILFSTYDVPETLLAKIGANPEAFSWLHYENFDNNILMYLEECNRLDTDPYQKNYKMIEGIDLSVFKANKIVHLSDAQIKSIVSGIYQNDIKRFDGKYNELALSVFAIDDQSKKYIVAYYTVCFDPVQKSLRIMNSLHFNKSFIIDKTRHSLSAYIDTSPDDFIECFENDPREAENMIKESFINGEKIDTRPDLMILERDITVNLSNLFETIQNKKENGTLSVPIKAFFGDISLKNNGRKEPAIVVYDKKHINPDQMRVIYNALKNPVTYVQGPPGTGKTKTLFNVVVSNYFNGRTMLVCTMNNPPVDGIVQQLKFQYHDENVPFPYLRLGNVEYVTQATKKIYEDSQTIFRGEAKPEKINAIQQRESSQNSELVKKLEIFEARRQLSDQIEAANKLRSYLPAPSKRLDEEIDSMVNHLAGLPDIKPSDITDSLSSTGETSQDQTFLYFSSIYRLNKLKQDRFAELRDIVANPDDKTRVSQFNTWTSKDENMKLLTEVYPLILTTNISANHLGTSGFMFDQVIMDEAGQCDIAKSLIPISRGNTLLLVGDEDQLQPVIVLDPAVNEKLKEKYKIKPAYDYMENSILSAMKQADNISKRVSLTYHYRCGRKIINFSNQYFYNNILKMESAVGEGSVHLMATDDKTYHGTRNECLDEAAGIVDYIKKNKVENAVIVAPFKAQIYCINKMLDEAGITSVRASTIHTMQGAEANTIIFSAAISRRTSANVFKWLQKDKEMVNVAVTRAKENLIVFADEKAVENLSQQGGNVWSELVKYAAKEGNTTIVPPADIHTNGKSNGSKNEEEFYHTMAQLCSVYYNYKIVRNVPVTKVFPEDEQLKNSGLEFDAVVYIKKTRNKDERPIIAFEVDGGEHAYDAKRAKDDMRKKKLCEDKNLKLVRIDNASVKNYEMLRETICKMNHDEYDQLLFDFGEDESSTPSN